MNAPARTPRHSGQWYTFVALIALVAIVLVVLLVLGLTGNLTSSRNATVTTQGTGGSSPAEQQFCQNLTQAGQATGQLRSSLQTRRRSVINDARRRLNTAIGDLNDANLPVDHAAVSELVSQASALQQAVIRADQQNLSPGSVAAVQAPLNQTQGQVLVVQRSASFCTTG